MLKVLERDNISEKTSKLKKIKNVLENQEGYLVSIAMALIIVSTLLVYSMAIKPPQQDYLTIYMLDSNKVATDFPEYLIIGENSTFDIYVGIKNHMNSTQNCVIQVKATNERSPSFPLTTEPLESIKIDIESGKVIEYPISTSLDSAGEYFVTYELWIQDESNLSFTGNFCSLSIVVVDNNSSL